MNTDNQIALHDGRRLGYAEYGDPVGTPVLHFHGTPDSRLEGCLPGVDELAARLGVRLILPDRPGLGLSDYQPNRRILDWPQDVLQLADALHLERFAVLGLSGGGPYVSACAHQIPERLLRAGIISGVGPLDAPGTLQGMTTSDGKAVALGGKAPWLLRIVLWYSMRGFYRDPQQFVDQVAAEVSLPD
jgi:pimeloyl-ACP methyl ester carboxylesterase